MNGILAYAKIVNVIREIQIKILMRYHYTLIRVAKIKSLIVPKVVRNWNSHSVLIKMQNGMTNLENNFRNFFKKVNIHLPYATLFYFWVFAQKKEKNVSYKSSTKTFIMASWN